MSRSKKTRNVKDILPPKRKEIGLVVSKDTKNKKKKKGLAAGNKQIVALVKNNKPAVSQPVKQKKIIETVTAIENKYKTPENELFALENDIELDKLISLAEQGKKLNTKQQQYIDTKLARIEQLAKQLNLEIEDDSDDALYNKFNQITFSEFE